MSLVLSGKRLCNIVPNPRYFVYIRSFSSVWPNLVSSNTDDSFFQFVKSQILVRTDSEEDRGSLSYLPKVLFE